MPPVSVVRRPTRPSMHAIKVTTSDVAMTEVAQPGDASPAIFIATATNDAMPVSATAATAASINLVSTRSVKIAIALNPCCTNDTRFILD